MTEVMINDLVEMIDLFKLTDAPISADTPILDEGVIDSLGVVQIASALEKEYSISLGPMDFSMSDFNTPETLKALVERLLG